MNEKVSSRRSRRYPSVYTVIDSFIFENNQIMLFPCLTFIPKTCMGLPVLGTWDKGSLFTVMYL